MKPLILRRHWEQLVSTIQDNFKKMYHTRMMNFSLNSEVLRQGIVGISVNENLRKCETYNSLKQSIFKELKG